MRKKNTPISINFPALVSRTLDTMGAGDAVFSFTSSFVDICRDKRIIPIIGAIAGALKTRILGHSSHIPIENISKSLHTILK